MIEYYILTWEIRNNLKKLDCNSREEAFSAGVVFSKFEETNYFDLIEVERDEVLNSFNYTVGKKWLKLNERYLRGTQTLYDAAKHHD